MESSKPKISAQDRVRNLLRTEAKRHWKERPLLVGGDEEYAPVKDRSEVKEAGSVPHSE